MGLTRSRTIGTCGLAVLHSARQTRPGMRIIVIVALIAVVAALFTALVFLYRDRGRGNRVVVALAIRVLLSMALIAFLVFAWWMGWIAPTGL